MNAFISPTHRARVETSARCPRDESAFPVAGTSAPSMHSEGAAATPDAPAEARPFTSPAAPGMERMPHEGESVRQSEKRGGHRVFRPTPAGAPLSNDPTPTRKITPRSPSGTTGNPAGRTTSEGPASVIFTGGGKMNGADLSRPTDDLAAEYGVHPTFVRRLRTQLGLTPPQRRRPKRVGPLTGVDLTRPTKEIVAQYGVTPGAVNRARARNGIPVNGHPPSVLALPGVDLTRPTKSLADEFSLSYSCIAKARKRMGVTWWEGKKADAGTGAKKRGGGHPTRDRAAAEARAAKARASADVARVAEAQLLAAEPTTKSDAWILRELQADMTPIVILAKRWKEPIERLTTLAARVGRCT